MKLLPPALQAFLLVARHGTVHAAAGKLALTQTAVTRRIIGLEEELGQTLFLRSRRGMALTDAGDALLTYCQQALDLEGETLAQLAGGSAQAPTRLVVQGPSSLLRARVIPAISTALKTHPRVSLEFRLSDVNTGAAALKRGEADLVIVRHKDIADEFASKKLKLERYVLVGPGAWQGRALGEVVASERIIDFDPSDAMTYDFLQAAGLRGAAREDRHFVNNTDALAAMVEGGHGYSVLSLEMATSLLAQGRLAQLGGKRCLDLDVALAWLPRRFMPAYLRDAIRAVR